MRGRPRTSSAAIKFAINWLALGVVLEDGRGGTAYRLTEVT